MSKLHSIVKIDKTAYSKLSDLDQFIVDKHIDHKKEYTVESTQTDQDSVFLILEEVPNIGFDESWFKVVG